MQPERHRARCEPRLNVGRVVRVGIAGQHLPQADVDEVVPSVVPGRTVRIHARLERRIRVRPVSDEIRHYVYQAPGTSPEGWQLRGIGGDRERHLANEGCVSKGHGRTGGLCGPSRLLVAYRCTTLRTTQLRTPLARPSSLPCSFAPGCAR